MHCNTHMRTSASLENAFLVHLSSMPGRQMEIASMLGWAVQRDISFQEALGMILEVKHGLIYDFCTWLFGLYEARVGFAIDELERGRTLSFALKRHLGKYLSKYYLAAVEKAEAEGRLAEILPQLAENLKYSSGIRQQYKAHLAYPAAVITIAIVLISGLYTFIVPKFEKIFCELFGNASLPPLTQFTIGIVGLISGNPILKVVEFLVTLIFLPAILLREISLMPYSCPSFLMFSFYTLAVFSIFAAFSIHFYVRHLSKWLHSRFKSYSDVWGYVLLPLILICIFIFMASPSRSSFFTFIGFAILIVLQAIFIFIIPYVYYRIVRFFFSLVDGYFIGMIFHLPLVGRQARNIKLLELSGAMATLTGAGYDVLDAARWNADAVSGEWLRKKLRKFVSSVEGGMRWAEAWEAMRLGSPTHNWIVRNSASRENPCEGFRLLCQWLRNEINVQTRVSGLFLEILCILLNALFIGTIIFSIWMCLFKMIYCASKL